MTNISNGDHMNNELLPVIGRTVLVLVILFGLTKCMGKKQVSQMNMYDYLVGITIGSIAADISLDIEKNLIFGIISLCTYSVMSIIVSYVTMNSFEKSFIPSVGLYIFILSMASYFLAIANNPSILTGFKFFSLPRNTIVVGLLYF